MAVSFVLVPALANSAVRLGLLKTCEGAVTTPTCLVPTRRGAVPHLMRDMTAQLYEAAAGGGIALQIHVDFALSSFSPGKTLPEWLAVPPNTICLCTQRDPFTIDDDLNGSNDKYAFLHTVKGRQKITASEYMRGAQKFGPVLLAAMSDTPPATAGRKRLTKSVDRSLSFLDACISAKEAIQPLFGVIQGGMSEELRVKSAQETASRPVDGFIIEGFGMGESPTDVARLLPPTLSVLPQDKVRIINGQSSPEEVVRGVDLGIDMFDAAYPINLAETGSAINLQFGSAASLSSTPTTTRRSLNLWDTSFQRDIRPISDGCLCYACRNHSRAYIHHLLQTHELLASVLLTSHNLYHYIQFFAQIRESIRAGTFVADRDAFLQT